jgi:hypothetical protein
VCPAELFEDDCCRHLLGSQPSLASLLVKRWDANTRKEMHTRLYTACQQQFGTQAAKTLRRLLPVSGAICAEGFGCAVPPALAAPAALSVSLLWIGSAGNGWRSCIRSCLST